MIKLKKVCIFCKRAKATHKGKLGQIELDVCKPCSETLNKKNGLTVERIK